MATFCHNIANKLPIKVNDPSKSIRLVYIDDVIQSFVEVLKAPDQMAQWGSVEPEYSITLQDLADQINLFFDSRTTLISERVGEGLTRGQHFHHSKSEKFIILKGKARFKFRHLITEEKFEIFASSDELKIIETIPGWVHDITNVGENEMIVMLWANEIFNRKEPDTISSEV